MRILDLFLKRKLVVLSCLGKVLSQRADNPVRLVVNEFDDGREFSGDFGESLGSDGDELGNERVELGFRETLAFDGVEAFVGFEFGAFLGGNEGELFGSGRDGFGGGSRFGDRVLFDRGRIISEFGDEIWRRKWGEYGMSGGGAREGVR